MKVGIDARLLAGPLTGIGRYTAELTGEVIKYPGRFFLYSARPLVVGDWRRANTILRAVGFRTRAGRMLWSQSILPYWAARDDVDVFWGPTHRLPALLPSSIARVVTIHDLVWRHAGETMRPLSRFVEGRLFPQAVRLADRIMADSLSTARDLAALYPESASRTRVVYPGHAALPGPLDPALLETLRIDRPYVLFVGTLEPRKNLARLVEAYASLDRAIRDEFLLVIVGGKGWGGVDAGALVANAGVSSQVRILGYVEDAELATLYAHARCLAMPSLYEGFGLPLVEAMAQGVPVLTSNRSSLPEVAGEAGHLVDPLDVSAIRAGLERLLKDDVYHARLAGKARETAEHFSWRQAAKETWAVFEEAVEERRQRRGR